MDCQQSVVSTLLIASVINRMQQLYNTAV